jgi:hypothetical protein
MDAFFSLNTSIVNGGVELNAIHWLKSVPLSVSGSHRGYVDTSADVESVSTRYVKVPFETAFWK